MATHIDLHHLLLLTFGILGNVVSFFVYFAPLPTFIQICRKKSTLGFQSLPYVVALFSAKLWMYYALLKSNAILLISINSFGCIIETIYVLLFIVYASKDTRKHTIKLLAFLNVGVFGSILLSTLFLVRGSSRVQVVGWIAVAISVAVFAAPLNIVFQVVRTRSVEFMPFTLSFFLTISAVMWFAYGLLQHDWCVALPNVIGFFLGLVQMALYGIYRKGKKKVEGLEKAAAAVDRHVIMNIMTVGNPDQVHPVDSSSQNGYSTDVVVPDDGDIMFDHVLVVDPQVHEREDENDYNILHQQQLKVDDGFNVMNLQLAVAA